MRRTARLYTAATSHAAHAFAAAPVTASSAAPMTMATIGCRRGTARLSTSAAPAHGAWFWASTRAMRAGEMTRSSFAGVCTTARASDAVGASGAAETSAREDAGGDDGDEDVGEDGVSDARTRAERNKRHAFQMPDEVPMSPPHYRTLLVKSHDDVALACATSCAEATAIARERMASGGYPPGSRQLRIIMPKIKSSEDAQAVIDLMALAHEHRTARYASESGTQFSKFNELVFLDLLRALLDIPDFERTAWVIENVPQLGGKMTKTIAKQGFYGAYRGPFELTYRVYDATRESFGSYYFASNAVVMVALNNGLVDLAKEYAAAFKESGVVVPNKAILRFLRVGVNTGDVETAQFGHDNYLSGIASLNEYKIASVKARNAKIESGEWDGMLSEIPESDVKPQTPFFYVMTACMHVLKGDVPAATNALNELVMIKNVVANGDEDSVADDGIEKTKAGVIENFARWPGTLYGNGYDATSREELRDALKSAIAGVTDEFVKDLLSQVDVDAAFAENVAADASEAEATSE